MEAIWKMRRVIGLTCCLGILGAVSMVRVDGTVSARSEQPGPQQALRLTDLPTALTGQQTAAEGKGDSLTDSVQEAGVTRSAQGGGVDWTDDFESYADGSCLHGQGGWEGWDNNPAWDACLQEQFWLSANSAVDISGNADLVRTYTGYTSGVWNYCTWQYIPDDFSGTTFFILLNSYPPDAFNWSTQISFDSGGLVTSDFEGATLPMITGQWVELCVEIDLDADSQTITYGGNVLSTKSWTAGVGAPGALNIAAVDLFATFPFQVIPDVRV